MGGLSLSYWFFSFFHQSFTALIEVFHFLVRLFQYIFVLLNFGGCWEWNCFTDFFKSASHWCIGKLLVGCVRVYVCVWNLCPMYYWICLSAISIFLMESLGSFRCRIISFVNKDTWTFSFLSNLYPLYFFYLICRPK